jgi:hypothetical protein
MPMAFHPLSSTNLTTIFGNCSGKALTAMGIMDKVRDRLLWQDGLLQLSIKNSKKPDVQILKDIIDFHTDNNEMMVMVLGKELMNEILKF